MPLSIGHVGHSHMCIMAMCIMAELRHTSFHRYCCRPSRR
jgi:hypothetical protein